MTHELYGFRMVGTARDETGNFPVWFFAFADRPTTKASRLASMHKAGVFTSLVGPLDRESWRAIIRGEWNGYARSLEPLAAVERRPHAGVEPLPAEPVRLAA